MERATTFEWTTHPDRAGSPARLGLVLVFVLTVLACLGLVYAALSYAGRSDRSVRGLERTQTVQRSSTG